MNRFESVKYDDRTVERNAKLKDAYETAETAINKQFGEGTPEVRRYKALALTALEESFMWAGKALREFQIANQGTKSNNQIPVTNTGSEIPAAETLPGGLTQINEKSDGVQRESA